MQAYRIYTIRNGITCEGAKINTLALSNPKIKIPVIEIGEDCGGKGRGILPVKLLPTNYEKWKNNETIKIYCASIGFTKDDKPKLLEVEEATTNEKIIVVFRTLPGLGGTCGHTGDIVNKYKGSTKFPGEILISGYTTQVVALMPRNIVFRTWYSGRFYGDTGEHFYFWNGQTLYSLTKAEKEVSNLF